MEVAQTFKYMDFAETMHTTINFQTIDCQIFPQFNKFQIISVKKKKFTQKYFQ